jgi:tetratricopeptide (TPR) repeat protein
MKRGRRAAVAARRPLVTRRPWLAWAIATLAAVVLVWLTIGRRRVPDPARPPDLRAAEQAYRRGLGLAAAGRYLESVPDFRVAVEARPEVWNLHHDYASALLNAAHEGRPHLGRAEFRMRSSIERVALLRQGLAELDAAARLVRDARGRAQIHRTRAQILKAWGLAWNAFENYRASEWADTTWTESAIVADDFMRAMENPRLAGD